MSTISLNPIEMFLQAGLMGKGVMLILLAASIWTWVLIFEGVIALLRLRSALQAGDGGLLAPLLQAGDEAAQLHITGESVGERRGRIEEALNRSARSLLAQAEGGLPNLAVISSVAPFIGLFGTVWGIMTSFAGIAEARDTSLAVVAPGIAEALAATAIGLAAAIPASIGYNRIAAGLGAAAQALTGLIEERAVALVCDKAVAPPHKEAA